MTNKQLMWLLMLLLWAGFLVGWAVLLFVYGKIPA